MLPDARKVTIQMTPEQVQAYNEFRKTVKFMPFRGDFMAKEFTIKDSGEKIQFESGMVRDTAKGKPKFELALDGPMFKRWAQHLTRACRNADGSPGKYETRNWMKATGDAELDRFIESAFHHFVQWLDGETDEDHAAAVFFNINGAEYVRERMRTAPTGLSDSLDNTVR